MSNEIPLAPSALDMDWKLFRDHGGKMTFQEKLKKLKACSDAVEWVGNRTAKQAWNECQRGDWMLWLIGNSNPKNTLALRRKIVLCACDIAETSLKYIPKTENRSAEALRIARAWAHGEKISTDQLIAASDAAGAASAAARSARDAAGAASAAASAAASDAAWVAASDAAWVSAWAAWAAIAAAWAARAAASDAASAAAWASSANIVRKYFQNPPKLGVKK